MVFHPRPLLSNREMHVTGVIKWMFLETNWKNVFMQLYLIMFGEEFIR